MLVNMVMLVIMIIKVKSAVLVGVESHLITVELSIRESTRKTNTFHIVGMADKAVQESKKRIRAALFSERIDLKGYDIVVNLAPAHLRKGGSHFDFPIAVALLIFFKKINVGKSFLSETLIAGELSFDGKINFVQSLLAVTLEAPKFNIKRFIVPFNNYAESSHVKDVEIVGVVSTGS